MTDFGECEPLANVDLREVLLLLPFPVLGAAEDYALTLAKGLVGQGWNVSVAHPRGLQLDGDVTAGLQTRILPQSLPKLVSWLRKMKPHLLHVNQVFLPGLAAARLSGTHPTVVTAHTPALPPAISTRGRVLERFGKPSVDRWIALSDANRELLSRSRGIAEDRIAVIPPGLPLQRFHRLDGRGTAASVLGVDPHRVIVGTVGRLSEQKRHDLLIEAFSVAAREIPALTLVIVGDGELRDRTYALARQEAAGNVHLVGHRSDVVRLLPAFDIFAMSSDFEGLPFALLEAMATGRAIVTTDVQGAGEAVRHEREGLLVPRRDPAALADAIVRLVRDRALAERLGQAAQKRFEAEFTADLMADRTEALYLELLAGGKGRR